MLSYRSLSYVCDWALIIRGGLTQLPRDEELVGPFTGTSSHFVIIWLNALECQWATMYESPVGPRMFRYDPKMAKQESDTRIGFHLEGYALFGHDWIFLNILEPIPNNRDY